MKRAIIGSEPKLALDPGSKKRLKSFRSNLSSDVTKVIFDDRVLSCLEKYVWRPTDLERTRQYLNSCRDEEGYPFSQSLRQWSKAEEALLRFSEPNYTSFRWNENYQKSLKELKEIFSQYQLKPLTYVDDQSIADALPKKTTHSGWHYILCGKKEKGEYLDGVFSEYTTAEVRAKEVGSFHYPILPGFRTQGSGEFTDDGLETYTCKHKTRIVSMIDIYQILAECKYAVPFQTAIESRNFYAGGKDMVSISGIIHDMQYRFTNYISLDYSHFDQSISDWLIRDAFDVIRSAFNCVDEELFRIIVHDFIVKDFISPDGVVHSEKGVPSGSMFTQIVDSIVNILMIKTYLKHLSTEGDMIVMGDDNLLYTNVTIDPEDCSSYIRKNFGITMNASKTSVGMSYQDPWFLSRQWRKDGQWRHPKILIAKLLFPERFRRYGEQVTPELIIHSYILCYSIGMRELVDVDRFYQDYPGLRNRVDENVIQHGPGILRYLHGHHANLAA